MEKTYREMIKELAESEISDIERGDLLIRDMCKTIDAILVYKYTKDYYSGNSDSVIQDRINAIDQAMAVMVGNMDIYMEILQITYSVQQHNNKRIQKILKRIRGS